MVFCSYQQVYDIFIMSCLWVILQVRGRDGTSTLQNGAAAYSRSHVSRICQGGFSIAFPAVFSECELTFMWTHVHVNSRSHSLYTVTRPSVVCLLSVTSVHPTQPVEILGNVSTIFSTLAIHWYPRKILRRSSHGNPSGRGVKCNRSSQI